MLFSLARDFGSVQVEGIASAPRVVCRRRPGSLGYRSDLPPDLFCFQLRQVVYKYEVHWFVSVEHLHCSVESGADQDLVFGFWQCSLLGLFYLVELVFKSYGPVIGDRPVLFCAEDVGQVESLG